MLRFSDLLSAPPAPECTHRALELTAELLGVRVAYFYAGAYHFRVGARAWTIALTPESAGRFRIEACHWSRPAGSLFTLAADEDRLASVVTSLAREIEGVPEGV